MDRGRGSAGMALGLLALALGVVGLVADLPALGVLAGLAGAAAGAAAVQLGGRADALAEQQALAERRVRELEEAVSSANDRAAEFEALAPEIEPEVLEDDAALLDPETGLYAAPYFELTLSGRVAAARRHLRPVAVVLLEVARGVRAGDDGPVDAALVADRVRATLREADTACRLTDNQFGLVLEDTPENGAVWTVERVRRSLASARADLTVWAGVACYPAHAFDAEQLQLRATAALQAAKQWRQDRIEVATAVE